MFEILCVVPENIHTHPREGYWKFQGRGGSQNPKCLKECMNQYWNWGGGSNQKSLYGRGMDFFWNTIFNAIFPICMLLLSGRKILLFCKPFTHSYIKYSRIFFSVGGDFQWSLVLSNQSKGSSEKLEHTHSTCLLFA